MVSHFQSSPVCPSLLIYCFKLTESNCHISAVSLPYIISVDQIKHNIYQHLCFQSWKYLSTFCNRRIQAARSLSLTTQNPTTQIKRTTGVNRKRTTGVNRTRSTDVNRMRSTDVNRMKSTGVNRKRNTGVNRKRKSSWGTRKRRSSCETI